MTALDTVEDLSNLHRRDPRRFGVAATKRRLGCKQPTSSDGRRTDVAAWFPWVDTRGAMRCLSDTVGIFLLGGCHDVRPLFSPKILTYAMAELDGVPRFASPDGQRSGLQLSQFWQCVDEKAALGRLSLRANDSKLKTSGWPLLPKCVQKRMKEEAVAQHLFQRGVHHPLLVFLGTRGRRSDKALAAREQKAATRKGKGKGKKGGEGRGGEAGSDEHVLPDP